MHVAIDALLATQGGVAGRAELLDVVSRHRLDNEIKQGHLVRLQPRTYARPWDAELPEIRDLAAVRFAGRGAALSHTTALRRWRLLAPPPDALIHVTVARAGSAIGGQGLTVHRTRHPLRARELDGIATIAREEAIVASWPLLQGTDRRAPLLQAVRDRVVDLGRLNVCVDEAASLPGRAHLRRLLDCIQAGCRSELELWGYLGVFNVRGLCGAVRQRLVRVHGRTYYLDMAYEPERLAVELDGRAYHASAAQWERDIRRDMALASAGWQTVRFSHRRLTTDVAGRRRDLHRVLAARRAR
jgi:very-short-patch-repair endonuclease